MTVTEKFFPGVLNSYEYNIIKCILSKKNMSSKNLTGDINNV